MPLDKPASIPWMSIGVTVLLSVGSGALSAAFVAGSKDADLRHETEARVALERRVETLEAYRGDMREVLADLKAEVRNMRRDFNDLAALIRGRTKLAKDE